MAVRITLESALGVYSLYLPFALAVMVAARVGGRGPGLAATALSTLSAGGFFLEPLHFFDIRDPAEVAGLALFAATATLISLLVGDLRESLLSTARAEDAMRKAHSDELARATELQAIMDAVPVAMFVSHDPECRNIIGNRRAYELLRAPPGSNLSKSAPNGEKPADYRVMRDGKEIPSHELPMQKAAATGQSLYLIEFEFVLEDGSRYNMIGSAVPFLDPESRSRGSVGTFVDITERKQNEGRLRQVQKLESVGLLAGGIAHDFNNLLTVIIGNADSALHNYPFVQEVEHIMSASKRAAELTRQLLEYAGKGQFVAMTFNLSDLVSRSTRLLSSSIPKRVELVFHVSEQELPIEADPSQIEQVLMNLVVNAGEAIPPQADGRIEIATSICEVTPDVVRAHAPAFDARPGRFVCLEVTDNGSGMDEATLTQIFDPFFSTKFTGRGLGLAAVQGIVRSCGGFIDVHSSSGAGSTFRVFLPAAETKPAAEIPAGTRPDRFAAAGPQARGHSRRR